MKNGKDEKKSNLSRRAFLGGAAAATAAFTIVPRHVLGGPGKKAPSDKLNIACIGVGGKGTSDIMAASTENIVALCDVDDEQIDKFMSQAKERKPEAVPMYEKAKKYRDFRIMLQENAKTIDAVTVSTPDHCHAVAAMMAIKMKKHAFVQKPLTHTIFEARKLAEEAKKQGVTTQMGNQGHASEDARLLNEWIWDGAIGPVREVHCFTNRPIWPQGIERPKEIPSCPPTLDWNVWLGPVTWRPYHPAYHPFAWRGFWDFGTGAIGDMGAHIMDHPYWALNLGYPKTVQASATKFTDDSYPVAEMITYQFPERAKLPNAKIDFPPVKLIWWDGGLTAPRPEELEPGRRIGAGSSGVVFIGDSGKIMCGDYGSNPRIIPETKMQAYVRPEKTIPRVSGIMSEWIECCKSGKKSCTDWSYSGPLTETMLLGCIAVRFKNENKILEWDPVKMEIPNHPDANKMMQIEYRQGWTL